MAQGSSKRDNEPKAAKRKKKSASKASKGKAATEQRATTGKHLNTERATHRAEADWAGFDDSFDGAADTSPGASEALQIAALHAIAAAKAFLDVAERAVQDPQLVGHALVAVRTIGKGVLGSLSGLAGHEGRPDDDPPLEHIEVG